MNEGFVQGHRSLPKLPISLHLWAAEYQKLREHPGEISLRVFLFLMPFARFLAGVQDRILGSVDFRQYSHFHVLLTQEIKETFPCEDGCNEQGITHE